MFALTMLTKEPPVISTPVAFGPWPPLMTVEGASLLPIAIPEEPPETRTPTASPVVLVMPWMLTPAIATLLAPLIVTGTAVAEP